MNSSFGFFFFFVFNFSVYQPYLSSSGSKCGLLLLNVQNDLEEFYAMVNFTNPEILGDAPYFRRYYEVS